MAQLFLLVLLLLSGPARSRDAAASLLARGNGHYQRGELARAVAAYEACLQLEPGGLPSAAADAHFVPCVINLASVLVDLGGHEQRAEQLYRVALAAEPEHADAAYNLALLLHDRKTEEAVEEAATMYRVAAEAEPERWDAWANLAAALKELRREPLGALHAYERAILVLESAEQAGGGEGGGEGSYLSKLYYGYGTLLADLSPEACGALAAQPQNLLLGTAEGGMPPAQLCAAAAQNAMRTAAAVDPSNAQARREGAVSRLYLGYISGTSRVHLGYISAVSRLYLGYISGPSRVYLGCISAVSRLYLGVSRVYLGCISPRRSTCSLR